MKNAPSPLALAIAAVASSMPAGCVLPHSLSWELGWDDSTLEGRAVVVEARVLEGGCTGDVLWTVEIGPDGTTEEPPTLGEGRYGFAARARDMQCRWFAEGCRELDLPPDDASSALHVVLSAATAEAACDAELCIAGVCACTAPGECGATCVGDSCACIEGECVERCTENGSCACTGGGCSMRCDEGSSCDCIGGGCTMDCGPSTTCNCLGGDCIMTCDQSAVCACTGGGCR